MPLRLFILLISLTTGLCACSKGDFVSGNKAGEVETFTMSVPEPSDLCLSLSGNSLMAVSDRGTVHEVSFDGKTIRTLSAYTKAGDLEGICTDPANNNIYVVNERTLVVSLLNENGQFLDSFTIPSSIPKPKTENDGIEGMTLHNDMFYFVNQNPAVLFSYNKATKQWSSPITLSFSKKEPEGVNAVSYDTTDNMLWILSSKSQKLYLCSLAGKARKYLDLSFITQPEGVWVDRTDNVAYICCDKTSKLYKVSLNKLQNYE